MFMLNDIPLLEKIQKLENVTLDKETFLRLFFSARNNTIESVCSRIKDHLQSRGFKTSVTWQECSRYINIEVNLIDKYNHSRLMFLERDRINKSNSDLTSALVYKLKSIQQGGYYSRKKPKIAEDFDNVLKSKEFFDFVDKEINRVNYPFGYNSYSSF